MSQTCLEKATVNDTGGAGTHAMQTGAPVRAQFRQLFCSFFGAVSVRPSSGELEECWKAHSVAFCYSSTSLLIEVALKSSVLGWFRF